MRVALTGLFVAVLVAGVIAQTPGGTIAGLVRDPSGAVVVGAEVQAVSRATGVRRTTVTGAGGEYSLPALLAGDYELRVSARGFVTSVVNTTVEAGGTTTADCVLRIGDVAEAVNVSAAPSQIRRESAAVGGVITRDQIDAIPLNGRSFLDLAKLEPGVQRPTAANRNRTVVPVLGAPASNVGGVRFTVDGGSVTSVALGGAQMNLSQEVVQEFQVATVNYDVSAGLTAAGAINVVTRSGGNQRQGSAFLFFRDHHLAAYPGLTRKPGDPDPVFRRNQFGVALGGPIRHNRVFYFGSWERNDQRAVATTTLLAPEFAHLSRLTPTPFVGDLFSARVDGRISDALSAFVRFSYDGSRAFGPPTIGSPNAYPSSWDHTRTRAHQTLAGLTHVVSPTLISDLRVSFFYVNTAFTGVRAEDCPDCLGIDGPAINIPQAGLVLGNSSATDNRERRFHVTESLTWQKSRHRVRFGLDFEHSRDRNLVWQNEPVTMTLYSPAEVRLFNASAQVPEDRRIPLPNEFRSLDEILQLPLQSFLVGIGDPAIPQHGGGTVRRWNTVWLYGQDSWRVGDRLTVAYGLGWGVDGVLNHDLSKPALLAPILGADRLGPTHREWTNFSPKVDVVWAPRSDGKTAVHASVGRFYGVQGLTSAMDAERIALGPPGLGRTNVLGSSILNPVADIPGVALNRPLDFRIGPTRFTAATLLSILPMKRAELLQATVAGDSTVRTIQIRKQSTTPIFPVDVPSPTAVHANAGVQREIASGLALSADVVYRHFTHVPQNGGSLDLNHFNSTRGPAIPSCTLAQRSDPQAICSLGPINVQVAPYWLDYTGMLLRVEKRLSRGRHLLASYAWSRNTGSNAGTGFNLDDWRQNTGPAGNDTTHLVNISGGYRLPWQLDLAFNVSYASVQPFTAFVGNIDFNGDGTTNDLLPGTTVNAFNRGLTRVDLERLVSEFNQVRAGTRDAKGSAIPYITLPASYAFGDDFHALDLRLSRPMAIRNRVRLTIIGELFNLYNAENLSGYSGDVTSSAFGQPTSRATQVFGSGGPRAVQLAVRVQY